MKGREPWLGLATVAGFVAMLLGEGVVDVVGLLVSLVPLAWGLVAWRKGRRSSGEANRL